MVISVTTEHRLRTKRQRQVVTVSAAIDTATMTATRIPSLAVSSG